MSYIEKLIPILAMTLIMIVGLSSGTQAQGSDGDPYKVILLGNLDDIKKDDTVIEALERHMENIKTPFAVIVNGDFSSEIGMEYLGRLVKYIDRRPACRIILTQGDRDWNNSSPKGAERIKEVEEQIESMNCPNLIWIGKNGCGKPEIITLDDHVQFIGINTQWVNHPYNKPTAQSGDCDISELDELYEELEDLIDDHGSQNILIGGHFPVRSNGPYGGHFPVKDWLFPVPFAAGLVTSYKKNVGGPKEINNENFIGFADKMLNVFLARNSLIYASGHENNLEVLKHGENYLINSGSIGASSHVQNSRFTIRKDKTRGFIELIYDRQGEVESQLYLVRDGDLVKTEKDILFQAPCENPIKDIPENDRFVPCQIELPILDSMFFDHSDSVFIVANPNYKVGNSGKFFLGEHYRKSWTAEVKVPQLDLDRTHGGLVPLSIGGGRQTKSLKFASNQGKEYVFRSVDKDPTKSLEYDLQQTVIDILLQDQTTTQHPYGALVVPNWLEELGILHASPKLYAMPDDPKLGPYRKTFGGMLGMLEESPTDDVENVFADSDDIKRSVKVIRKMYKDRDNQIATEEFIIARMFDIYLGDWGRHEDNWKWAGYDQENGTLYRPIPRDRDHVFSKWDGFLPWMADREWAKASGENFATQINDMRSLTWQNRHMDRFLLSEASRADWISAAKAVKEVVTPESIRSSVNQMPTANADLNQKEIIYKLDKRAEKLEEFANRYYELLAKEVDVVGSNKHELFEIEKHEDGRLDVAMYKLKDRKKKDLYYLRTFYPDETKEVRLFGLGGDDIFNIKGKSNESIMLRIIPGLEADTINNLSTEKSKSRDRLYIDKYDKDEVIDGGGLMYVKNADLEAYDYDRQQFHYNTYFPIVYLFYNSDRGLDLSGRVDFTNYKYGNEEYSSRHLVNARFSSNGNLSIKYKPRWNNVVGKWDVVAELEYEKNRDFNYYFGKNPEIRYNDDLLLNNFYSLNYSSIGMGIGISQEFWRNAEVSAIFTGYYNSKQRRRNTIADQNPNIRGLKSGFNTQLEVLLDFDLRDRADLPSSGYRIFANANIGTDIQSEAGSYLSAVSHLEVFHTFHPFTLGLRAGGAINEGDVPYFLLQYLGRDNYLRGYRQNRFFGDHQIFGNTELRIQLVDTRKAFIPMKFGLKLFLDAGRVFTDELPTGNSTWKMGYGGGIFLVPYKERLTLNLTAGFSEEESLLIQFRLGRPF